jgi:hypothetical protein
MCICWLTLHNFITIHGRKKHKKILVPSNHILVENPTGVTAPSVDRLRYGAGYMTLHLAEKQAWMKSLQALSFSRS